MKEFVGKSFDDNLNDEIICKKPAVTLNGHLQDVIKKNGSETSVDQGNNTICIGCHTLICELIAGVYEGGENLYFAIGDSDVNADGSDLKLGNFLFKHKIGKDDKEGIVVNGNELTLTAYFGANPTDNDIDINGEPIDENTYNSTWRECAILKGHDNDKEYIMLNRKTHSPIEKSAEVEAIRTFKFTF